MESCDNCRVQRFLRESAEQRAADSACADFTLGNAFTAAVFETVRDLRFTKVLQHKNGIVCYVCKRSSVPLSLEWQSPHCFVLSKGCDSERVVIPPQEARLSFNEETELDTSLTECWISVHRLRRKPARPKKALSLSKGHV